MALAAPARRVEHLSGTFVYDGKVCYCYASFKTRERAMEYTEDRYCDGDISSYEHVATCYYRGAWRLLLRGE